MSAGPPVPASRRWPIGVALTLILLSLPFWFGPVDLATSSLFYRSNDGFFLADRLPLRIVYTGTYWYVRTIVIALLGCLVWSWLPSTKWQKDWRGRIGFLVLSLAIGPGLITNTLFKDHWGRPRPEHLEEFGGHAHYVPLLLPSSQCDHNCSFPSGHAAAGFWLISGAWVWPHRRRAWLAAGLTLGGIIGLTRIAQGGHFLSDVVAALAVVWLVNECLSRRMRQRGWWVPPSPQIR